jgi:hypothetical protein
VKHFLKTRREHYDAVASGYKRVELRRDDRGFAVGDTLVLQEWEDGAYTGRAMRVEVTHVLSGWGLPAGLVALSIGAEGVTPWPSPNT